MATEGEVRFAGNMKAVMERLKGYDLVTATLYPGREDVFKSDLQGLVVDAKMLIAEGPKRALIVNKIINQAAYWNTARRPTAQGGGGRSATATAGHVAKQLVTLFPILDIPADQIAAITGGDVPAEPGKTATTPEPAMQVETGKKPSEVFEEPKPEKKGMPWWGWAGIAVAAGAAFLGGRKSK